MGEVLASRAKGKYVFEIRLGMNLAVSVRILRKANSKLKQLLLGANVYEAK